MQSNSATLSRANIADIYQRNFANNDTLATSSYQLIYIGVLIHWSSFSFVNLKAYDWIPREKLCEVLQEYSADSHLLLAIKSLYFSSEVCVCVTGVKSQTFTIGGGLQQRCVLSPLLFIVYMKWIDSHSWVKEGVTDGSCRINRLLFVDDLVLLASSQQGLLSIPLISFLLHALKPEWRLAPKRPRYYVSLERGNTLQEVEKFKHLGVVFTSHERQSEEIDTLISKGNAVLRELYHSVVTKRKFSNTAKLSVLKSIFVPILFFFGHFSVIDQNVFWPKKFNHFGQNAWKYRLINTMASLNTTVWQMTEMLCDEFVSATKKTIPMLTYGHDSWVMTEKTLSQVQTAEMGFLQRVHGVTFRDKVRTAQLWNWKSQPWMSNHFSESSDPSYIGSAMCPEWPMKGWQGKSCWLYPQESSPEVIQGPVGVTTSPSLLGPILVWSQKNYLKLLLTHAGILSPPRDSAPMTLPREKWVWKWMKAKIMHEPLFSLQFATT